MVISARGICNDAYFESYMVERWPKIGKCYVYSRILHPNRCIVANYYIIILPNDLQVVYYHIVQWSEGIILWSRGLALVISWSHYPWSIMLWPYWLISFQLQDINSLELKCNSLHEGNTRRPQQSESMIPQPWGHMRPIRPHGQEHSGQHDTELAKAIFYTFDLFICPNNMY